jgi:DNA-directed RNA polymerase subunit alpha
MSLSVKEARAITAADFSKDALVEIVNPDLHIATLTESSGSFDMEVWIGKGRGYRPTEERLKEKLELGTIAVDALYSPVVNVSYKVEATRVGDKTDYDKLVLKIETDGSLDPIDAVNQGVGILNDYVNVLKDVSYTEAT